MPSDYYEFVKGNLSLEDLYDNWPKQTQHAKDEAWNATLGFGENASSNSEVDKKIDSALNGAANWMLIGGPPCQAYSVVGRSRRQEKLLNEETDERVGLYKQYLRILAIHNPTVFVMENVKGLLSAETKESPVFTKILEDLSNPVKAYLSDFKRNGRELNCPGYKIYSLVVSPNEFDPDGNPVFDQKDFIIHAENYGVPQTRHRVILLGVRKTLDSIPSILKFQDDIPISSVLSGLPRLRSKLSKTKDDVDAWKSVIGEIQKNNLLNGLDKEIKDEITKQLNQIRNPHQGIGAEYIPTTNISSEYRSDWYLDSNLKGISNHASRSHMESDLQRYFFVSCFAKVRKTSPRLEDFPNALLPNHENVDEGIKEKKFADRFRVQILNKPSKTITSHISKDGHYYIHPDPTQCRSFTVREAARVQTFPDNYHFCGPRTSQFIQVGNAVPPLLAYQIAKIVASIFIEEVVNRKKGKHKALTRE
ncbi:restriction endonuclease subunit M [Cytophagales bacterium WSM2-2]|nr:restriction endonuclease subunit M [Cytophagales bacterium WSM2-2]